MSFKSVVLPLLPGMHYSMPYHLHKQWSCEQFSGIIRVTAQGEQSNKLGLGLMQAEAAIRFSLERKQSLEKDCAT